MCSAHVYVLLPYPTLAHGVIETAKLSHLDRKRKVIDAKVEQIGTVMIDHINSAT